METLFWSSALVIAYVYAGYPLLLAVWSAVARRPVRKRMFTDAQDWPAVSVILAAHNEGAILPARIANLLEQTYPRPLDIIVVSNGSTDNTAAALQPFGGRVRLIELHRAGKALALNEGVAAATGEIIVFADARQRFAPDAILELAANFNDPDIGGVSGELILDCELEPDASDSTVSDGVGLYWKYEKWLRRHESRVASTLGATGAIYALRRSLWQPLPASTLLDDVLAPMRVVLAGKRVIFEERARAYDRAAPDGAAESRRKTRTLAGNYQILALEPRLLLPIVNPVWLQYISHKVGRLLVPWALVAEFAACAVLAPTHWLFAVALMLQLGFYGLAALGAWNESRERHRPIRADDLPAGLTREGRTGVSGPRPSTNLRRMNS
jgi:cellulose synthase/poly-beta-1,6-N-acetylglucosamine synthase-like glycosyltransferase